MDLAHWGVVITGTMVILDLSYCLFRQKMPVSIPAWWSACLALLALYIFLDKGDERLLLIAAGWLLHAGLIVLNKKLAKRSATS
ncbi:MAG: hypothetical protein COV34_00860 [Candidatus Zambryskibacteria bacterium CG10_big_fil_rev_8_21_14_0_10_42_12]|uniref:Uncharacterized protein n=1 Tax=Candidatus Zambryskibacteria bacterium CG10_big_fil_rev_8_21_14_0_10_42_12 TaxID=1975115 RepID=A0A2H0QWG3_9BACT|nr:MAG: hypothetical protein COV34_00860 [Candidatus Zambryskibacteria bacterium CG10_big_fil_rev_8_21_14_0_10_42_12]